MIKKNIIKKGFEVMKTIKFKKKTGSPRLPDGGVINCNGNGILNQNQVLMVMMVMPILVMMPILLPNQLLIMLMRCTWC